MFAFLVRRVALLVVVLVGLSALTFVLSHLVPTDPARAALGFDASPDMVAQYRREMGLDRALPIQYVRYMGHLLVGNLGVSIMTRRSVAEDLARTIPATLELTVASLVLSITVGGALGVVAAVRRGSIADTLATAVPVAQLSTPIFVLGLLLLLVFYRWLGWFPYGGRLDPGMAPATITGLHTVDALIRGDWSTLRSAVVHLVLPAVALSNLTLAEMTRITRSAVLEVLTHDYVRTARSKGLSEWRVIVGHVLKNAAIPVVTVMGLRIGFLMGGAVITETIFAWPGVGRLLIQSIGFRDYPLVQGCILLIAVTYVGMNLLTDLLYGLVDPRIRYE
jgi:peptide/nickel transport system permease protein